QKMSQGLYVVKFFLGTTPDGSPSPSRGGWLSLKGETGWGRQGKSSADPPASILRSVSPSPPHPVASRPPSPGRAGRGVAPGPKQRDRVARDSALTGKAARRRRAACGSEGARPRPAEAPPPECRSAGAPISSPRR